MTGRFHWSTILEIRGTSSRALSHWTLQSVSCMEWNEEMDDGWEAAISLTLCDAHHTSYQNQ